MSAYRLIQPSMPTSGVALDAGEQQRPSQQQHYQSQPHESQQNSQQQQQQQHQQQQLQQHQFQHQPLRQQHSQEQQPHQHQQTSQRQHQPQLQHQPPAGGTGQQQALPPDAGPTLQRTRRRRAPANVSQNACTNCKKARAKCDGEEPYECSRCVERHIADSCRYEVHTKTVKEELLKRIKALEASNAEKDRLLSSVVHLLADEKNTALITHLKQDPAAVGTLEAVQRAIGDGRRTRPSAAAESIRRTSDSIMSTPSDDEIAPRWVAVVADEATAHHLMGLYFSWIHPVHMLFSERHFMRSFRSGDSAYCSQAMLNAMCALGCIYSIDAASGDTASAAMLEKFFSRARIEVESEDRAKITTSIAYAMLALIESTRGLGNTGHRHLRLAAESLRAVDRRALEHEAIEICLWGIHTLNTTWASFTYQKPPDPMRPRSVVFEDVDQDGPASYWMFYRQPGDSAMERLSSAPIATAKAFAQLNQLVLETMNVFCGRLGRVTSRSVLELYNKYLIWQEKLPDRLARPSLSDENEVNSTVPHVLFLHIHYQVALAQLFAPLLDEVSFPKMSREHVRRLSLQSAREGLQLYDIYRRRFGNQYQAPLQTISLVHLADTILKHGAPGDGSRIITFCLEAFAEALPRFAYIGPLGAMFCENVIQYGHSLPPGHEHYLGGRTWQSFTREEKLDCCERLNYSQPTSMLVERLDTEIADSFEEQWNIFIEQHGGSVSAGRSTGYGAGGRGDGSARSGSAIDPTSESPERSMDVKRLVNY